MLLGLQVGALQTAGKDELSKASCISEPGMLEYQPAWHYVASNRIPT